MACGIFRELLITDGTTTINLLNDKSGFSLEEWRPRIAEPKGGGVWADSSLADGRRLKVVKTANVVETYTLTVRHSDTDSMIRDTQELRRLLEKARSYWTTDWQDEPVWLEAVGVYETNKRYSLIMDYRTPADANPYAAPFWPKVRKAGMYDFDVVIERGPFWRADEPGTGTATQISGTGTYCSVVPLLFDGVDDEVNCGSPAGLDDLPDNAVAGKGVIVVDGWIKPGKTTDFARVISKGSGTNAALRGWHVVLNQNLGLEAYVDCATQDARSASGLDEYALADEWAYFMMVYDETGGITPAARTIYLNVNGTWVASYAAQIVSIGNYSSDAGDNLLIGRDSSGTNPYLGYAGWMRVRDALPTGVTVGVDFTAPSQCPRPDVDANTQGQYIWEGTGATTGNEGAAGGSGAITGALWDTDECCSLSYGRAATTLDEVYIGNKQNMANITHIFTWSAANGFSANLMNAALPYDLIDIAGAAPAVNDYVAFGIDTAMLNSGPFASLVFDIGTAISGITADDWEYSTGVPGWADLAAEQDNTNQDGVMAGSAFDTTGVGSVHWEQPTAWAPQALNGITAYWIRVLVTAAPGAHVAPTQQNRDVYTITWPFVELASTAVLGDVVALARHLLTNQSDHDGTNPPTSWSNRILVGLRSVSRGSNFTAYINFADEQNPTGITVAILATGSFQTDMDAPSGRLVRVTAPGALPFIDVSLDSTIADEYEGTYHVFVRGTQVTGAAGDVLFRLRGYINVASSKYFYEKQNVAFTTMNNFQILDFGRMTIPGRLTGKIVDQIVLQFTVAGAVTFDFYDLILLPVDEWAIDTVDLANVTGTRIGRRGVLAERSYLDIDPITYSKKWSSLVRREADDLVLESWLRIAVTPPVWQANAQQRAWFLSTRYPSSASLAEQRSEYHVSHTVQAQKVQRYLSMRGER
jgi:hypothetical protein